MIATIVLAEDDADLRAIYAECLRREGYQIWEACDGAETLRLVCENCPLLLILDLWMPILNGLEVLEHLANVPQAIGLKTVVLTHQDDSDTRLEGYALGICDYWTKDISLGTFRERVRDILGTASATSSTSS